MAELPPLPPGFKLDQPQANGIPPLPPGFTLDQEPPASKQPEKRTDYLRQIALLSRAAGEGVVGTLAIPHDLGVGMQNLMARGINKVFGTDIDMQPTYSQELSDALTQGGSYTPETPGENMATTVTRGVTGALTGGGLTGVKGANVLRTGIAGATGAGASEATRQAGYGPGVQFVAGLAGGLAPSAIESAATIAGHGVRNAVRPLTRSGQTKIAEGVLADQADDPVAAAARLRQAGQIVPGSPRTTGEASQDIGLLGLEKGMRSKNPAAFGERFSERNTAQQAELRALGGTPADIAAAQAQRDSITGPMRTAALGNASAVKTDIVSNRIDQILASPAGKRESVASALNWAKSRIGDEVDPAALYEIRKDLQLAQRGRLQPSSPNAPNASSLGQARGELGQVVSALDDAIEASAPGFKAYLQRYRDLSRPIDEAKVIQEITRRAQLSTADVTTGQSFLGNAAFGRALDTAIQKNGTNLTPEKLQRLEAIRTDLQLGQAINSPLVKAPGSDTFQNISIAQVIGAASGDVHPAFRVLTKPLHWVYKVAGSDERVNQILTEAMLDPALASQMLQRATRPGVMKFSDMLRKRVEAGAIGAGAVAMSNRDSGRPEKRNTQTR